MSLHDTLPIDLSAAFEADLLFVFDSSTRTPQRPTRYSVEAKRLAIALVLQDGTYKQASAVVGASVATIRGWCKAAELHSRRRPTES